MTNLMLKWFRRQKQVNFLLDSAFVKTQPRLFFPRLILQQMLILLFCQSQSRPKFFYQVSQRTIRLNASCFESS